MKVFCIKVNQWNVCLFLFQFWSLRLSLEPRYWLLAIDQNICTWNVFLSGATIVIVLVCCKNKQTNKKLWWLMFSENSVESGLYQEGKGSVPVKIAVAFVLFMVSELLNSDSIISYLYSFSVTLFFFYCLNIWINNK